MAKIVELHAENFKRLSAITIHPDGPVVVLNGANGSGKTSALDAIWSALGGKSASPKEPIRDGQRNAIARVVLDSGIVAERTWSRTGCTLKLTGAEGQELKKPQDVLNALCSKHTIDPLAFAAMDDTAQAALLKRSAGLDFSELDRERQRAYDERTIVNRDAKRLEAELDGMPRHDPKAPKEELSIDELSKQYREAQHARFEHDRRVERLESAVAENDKLSRRIETMRLEMQKLQDSLTARVAWVETESSAIDEAAALLVDPQESDFQLAVLYETNTKVRANRARAAKETELSAMLDKAGQLTEKIEAVDLEKAEKLAAAQFPVEGLGFDDSGVTYRGVPFSQASHAERVRVSAAIGLALHPELRVLLVRDAEKLDADGMKLMAELAEEHDAQIWLERAGHSDPGAVVIEDGAVADAL